MSFAETFATVQVRREQYFATKKEYEEGLRQEREALFRRRFPKKRKVNLDLLAGDVEYEAIFARWRAKADELISAWHQEQETRDAQLRTEAAEELPTIKDLQLVETVYASTYATQGFGASGYAQAAAENLADLARHYGVPAGVQPVGKARSDKSYGIRYQDYGVFVQTTPIGWEMLKLRPEPSMREWLKMCWKRGVNPRVYNPYLPHGIEAKLGLDCFGNEVDVVKV